MTRGGKRPGPGHPVTTGMASTPPIHFRLSKRTYERLCFEAKCFNSSPSLMAKWVTERWVAGRVAAREP